MIVDPTRHIIVDKVDVVAKVDRLDKVDILVFVDIVNKVEMESVGPS